MFSSNILSVYWMFCIVAFSSMFIIGRIPKLPGLLWNLISYGKSRNLHAKKRNAQIQSSVDKLLDVPKQWFTHFYVVSAVCNGFLSFKLVEILFFNGQMPAWYMNQFRFLTDYPLQTPKASHISVVIAIFLLFIQGVRRLYECLFVSSYSKSTIHLAHYIFGILFYVLAGMSVLAEGPDLEKASFSSIHDLIDELRWFNIVGVVIFLWASYHHHVAHRIFASLRKGGQDRSHRIPHGDWFELVSCPHYLAEILIYVAVIITLGLRHTMSYFLFGFTVTNQLYAGMTVHTWYQQKFDNYPKNRKAIIPWIL